MQGNKEGLVHHPHLCREMKKVLSTILIYVGKKRKKKDRAFGGKDDAWFV